MIRSQRPLSKVDLTYEIIYNPKFVLAQSPTAMVKTVVEKGARTTHMLRVGTAEYGAAQFYILDEPSEAIWELIDGTRTVNEIVNEALTSGEVSKTDDAYGALLFFAESGALKSKQDTVPWKRVRFATSFISQVALVKDSTRVLTRIHRVIRPALGGLSFWACMAISLVGVIIYAPRFNSTFNDTRNFQVLGSSVVGYLFYNFVILAPVIVVHELAHAMALLHYSGRSGEIGTGWFYFGPLFYADVTAYWGLPRRQRLMIMWSGNLTTILIGSLLVLSQLVLPLSSPLGKTFDIAAFWCFYGTLWSLAPPFETDGYYILADLLKIPNLRHEGFGYLKSIILGIFGRQGSETEVTTTKRKVTLLGYAIGSIVALGYIGFQSIRFALYMGIDANAWGERLFVLGPNSTPLSLVVGLTSIGYFILLVMGYGTLIGNQVKKSWVRGLKFEAVHDRHVAIFCNLPPSLSPKESARFEGKFVKLARGIGSNFSLGRKGSLLYVKLAIGSSTLPLSQIRLHLRRTEDEFYKTYQRLLDHSVATPAFDALFSQEGRNIKRTLEDMARNGLPGERQNNRRALDDSLRRHELAIRMAVNSTFASAWSLETPPAQQYSLLQDFLPGTLIEDLTMANLPGDTEAFKKQTIYGLDTIAQLATAASTLRDRFLAHPEKFEIVSLFEPVRGRITFVGKTERIEESLEHLGVLFFIHVWSGYVDDLLADTNLNLYAIAQSLPSVPEELSQLRDGELFSLNQYILALEPLENRVLEAMTNIEKTAHPSLQRLKELKTLFEAKGEQKIGEFDSVLSLNLENIRSIPARLKDTRNMSQTSFLWLRALRESVDSERNSREAARLQKKTKLTRNYGFALVLSIVLVGGSLFQPLGISLVFLSAGIAVQAAYAVAVYQFYKAYHRVLRYPSTGFSHLLPAIYAVGQATYTLLGRASIFDANRVLEDEKQAEKSENSGVDRPGNSNA